jgi:hypothetical protein
MIEQWRFVIGYEGLYQVSNIGNVRRLKDESDKLLKLTLNQGYLRVNLCKNNLQNRRTVHSLVAESFLGHKPEGTKTIVKHINGNKTDNRVENLKIVTMSSLTKGIRKKSNKEKSKFSSKYRGVYIANRTYKGKTYKYIVATIQINNKRKFLGSFTTEEKAAQAYLDALKTMNL